MSETEKVLLVERQGDLRFIAEGDKVVARLTARGTHQGLFRGIPPTGRVVTWTGIRIFRIAEGKIVEHWANWDDLSLLKQLGGSVA